MADLKNDPQTLFLLGKAQHYSKNETTRAEAKNTAKEFIKREDAIFPAMLNHLLGNIEESRSYISWLGIKSPDDANAKKILNAIEDPNQREEFRVLLKEILRHEDNTVRH